jgi:hypothetical protein
VLCAALAFAPAIAVDIRSSTWLTFVFSLIASSRSVTRFVSAFPYLVRGTRKKWITRIVSRGQWR